MPTKRQYRHAVLEEIGGGGVYTTTALGTTTTIICTTAFLSSALPSDHLAHAWVHVPSGGVFKQRRVTATGLDGSTGTITVDGVFGGAVAAGVEFEISNLLPLIDGSGKSPGISIDQCVYLGMRRLLVPGSRIDVTTVANQQEYPLTAQAGWLDDVSRVVDVYDPARAAGFPRPISRLRWALNLDDGAPMLQFLDRAYPEAGFTFQIAVQRPGHTLVSGAESTTGLSSESDTSPLSLNDVTTAALVFAYQALAALHNGPTRAEYLARYEAQLGLARALPTWDTVRDRLLPAAAAAGAA